MQATSDIIDTLFSKLAPLTFLIIVGITGYIIWYYYKSASYIGLTSNIAPIVATVSDNSNAIYSPRASERLSLANLLSSGALPPADVADACLSNFYILTANMASMFPPSSSGVYDPSAIKYAIMAGARGFIFDIYSGSVEQNYAPMLKVLQPGSNWKVQTMNEIPLGLALDSLRKEGFETGLADNRHNDPMILYFRFRGSIITTTLNLTAAALRATLEGYRVSTSENASIAHQPIANFNRKVIIYSNLTGSAIQNTAFADYCNSLPGDEKGSSPNNYDPKTIMNTTDATNTTDIINKNKNVISICAPLPENTMSNDNNWMVDTTNNNSPIDLKGIQMVGLNMFSFVSGNLDAGLSLYLGNSDKFKVYSFWIKPAGDGTNTMRYKITLTTPPQQNTTNSGNGTVNLPT
jgi:hypothetical protein